MRAIDLHVHSCYSDGTLRPETLIQKAAHIGLRAMALTDHDTMRGIPYATAEIQRLGLRPEEFLLIPGIEVTAGYLGRDIHILGLFVNAEDTRLNALLETSLASRIRRNEEMLSRFQAAGISLTMEELMAGTEDSTITRAHFAKVLIAKGYAENREEAFAKYLCETSPFYLPRTYLDPKEVIDTLHGAGAFVSLAHPMLYPFTKEQLETLISKLKQYGLDGIETIYCTYTPEEEACVRRLADRYGLLLTGGSDYHGDNKPGLQLGTGYDGGLFVPETVLGEILRYQANHQ